MFTIGQRVFVVSGSKIVSGWIKSIGSNEEGVYYTISAGCALPSIIKMEQVFKSRTAAKLAKYKKELEHVNDIIKFREAERDNLINKINRIKGNNR